MSVASRSALWRKRLTRTMSALAITSCVACATGEVTLNQAPPEYSGEELASYAMIEMTSVASPLGRYLLLRRKNEGCAVRFWSPARQHDARAPSVFTSGEETTSVNYESLYIDDGTFDLSTSRIVLIRDVASNRASVGVGHVYSQKPGAAQYVVCGPMKINWTYPHFLSPTIYKEGAWIDDPILELAPTAIEDRKRIDFSDPKLRWFNSRESHRTGTRLPEKDLPH